jgi:chemotaxis protein methyltransferase CheR
LESFALLPKFDLILCRNVLIYQSVKNKMDVISKMYDQLKPEGILILGAAENLYGLSNDFDQLQGAEGAIYFRKKG